MASTIATAQDIMLCEVCDKLPLQMHCNKCGISLCKTCVADHVMADTSKPHEIVIYKMRNIDPVFPDCKTHSHQKCEMYCRECDIPLCVKCIASHTEMKHIVTEILDIFNTKKEILQQKSKELENSVYPKYEEGISELENLISKLPESYEKLMLAISEQGEAWHREIDIIINKTKKEVEKMKNQDLNTLNKNLSEMKNLLSTIYQAIMEIRKFLKSNNVQDIMSASSETPEFRHSLKKLDVKPPKFLPSVIQGEQLSKMFGALSASSISETHEHVSPTTDTTKEPDKRVLDSPREISNVDPDNGKLTGVACLNPNEVWVCGNTDEIKHVHMDGSLQQTATPTFGTDPRGITVTPQGELIYIDLGDSSIYIIRNGKHEKMIRLKDWRPKKVCYTASGDLLVTMFKYDNKIPKKVVHYRGRTEKQVIQFDQNGKPWFSTGSDSLFIDENRNGDLCASDCKAKQVVVFNQAGKLQFTYTGNLSSKKYKSFYPRGISTDVLNQILVADDDNNCIHIINQEGHFICYIDNCHLTDPYDLSVHDNFVFVAEFKTGKLKKIQYLM